MDKLRINRFANETSTMSTQLIPRASIAKSFSALLIGVTLLCVTASSASALPANFFGLITHGNYWESEADWEAMGRSGAETIRMQLNWWQVHQAGGWMNERSWQVTYDKYFEYAVRNGLTILPYLYGRKDGGQTFYRSTDADWNEWFQFVWTAVQRYGRGGTFWGAHPNLPYKPITTWEIWNEPNLKINNPGGTSIQPRNYARFFVPTSRTITDAQNAVRRAGEPNDTKILPGGLYQEAGTSIGMSVWEFFNEIAKDTTLNNQFKSHNSGLSLHPYSFAGSEAQKVAGVADNINAARNALTQFDSAAKPIWITELGWPVLGAAQHAVSEAEQASLLTRSFNWIKDNQAAKNIALVIWYFYRDAGLGGDNWDRLAGLRDINGQYRPAWYSYLEQTGASIKTIAFHANDHDLWTLSPNNVATHYGLGLAAGTNPSMATLVSGQNVTAFQANSGNLWTFTPSSGGTGFGLGMAAGTSPSVSGLSAGSYIVAFQANTSNLWTYTPSGGATGFGLGMAAGTSPSATGVWYGSYAIAFQANTGYLWTYTPSGVGSTGLKMRSGTSPSIAPLWGSGYVEAIQADTGDLWTYTSSGAATHFALGIASRTNPSVAGLPGGGYAVAFQSNDGYLWTYNSVTGASGSTGFAMAPGTSPSISGLSNGSFAVAFQAPNNDLWTFTPAGGGTHYGLGLAQGTSPAMAPS
jgi:hypothetical protein